VTDEKHLNPFEHGASDLSPILPGLAAVEEIGLHRYNTRFCDGIPKRVTYVYHRGAQFSLAQTPPERTGDIPRPRSLRRRVPGSGRAPKFNALTSQTR
jgi:hypothetical protein